MAFPCDTISTTNLFVAPRFFYVVNLDNDDLFYVEDRFNIFIISERNSFHYRKKYCKKYCLLTNYLKTSQFSSIFSIYYVYVTKNNFSNSFFNYIFVIQ